MEKQLELLSISLDQKMMILQQILLRSVSQQEVLEQSEPDLEAYDKLVDEKDELIDRLEHLDEGFEMIYADVSQKLTVNKEKYRDSIKTLQGKIGKVTEMGIKIQNQEKQNKTLLDSFFAGQRKNIRETRQNSKAAYDYYRRMSGMNPVTSTFMDSKKYRE